MTIFILNSRAENIMEKEENTGYKYFILFPTMFISLPHNTDF